ncbi:MAG: FprA family A-type flavoprotein [Deltaproteobacteria bacterium]|jgi:flavorubredoxin|nr:FprA family A-type flavoprotein [Deltaproteobacteria bacterium]
MKPFALKDDIYWVGAVDYSSRDFHGYSRSPQGTTYNAYLVKDEKVTLFDAVKAGSLDVMLQRIRAVVDPIRIDYIVVNHLELDHSGALPHLVALCKPEKIFCSPMGLKAMEAHFNTEGWPIEVKKTGDTLSLGKRTVSFIEARMLHWPDSMFSYLAEDKLLICNDAFGQNIACSERFSDEVDRADLEQAMKEYYHNIVQPFASQVLKALAQVAELKLDIDMLAPDHGLIFRGKEDVAFALETYRRYATPVWKKRAVIVFDTMWHSTEKMAYAIGDGLCAADVPYRILPLKSNHHSAIMTELADAGAVLVGSPTHNNGIMPGVANVLTYMKGLRPQLKIGAAFGSFGWSGEGARIVHDWLETMGFAMPLEPLTCKFVPKNDTLEQCFAMGQSIGKALAERCDAR